MEKIILMKMFGVTVILDKTSENSEKHELFLDNTSELNHVSELEKHTFFNTLEKVVLTTDKMTDEQKENTIFNMIERRAKFLGITNPFAQVMRAFGIDD